MSHKSGRLICGHCDKRINNRFDGYSIRILDRELEVISEFTALLELISIETSYSEIGSALSIWTAKELNKK
jgi:hypothetical protein